MRTRNLLALLLLLMPLAACAGQDAPVQRHGRDAAVASAAAAPELQGEWTQGAGIVGRVEPGSKVALNGRELRVSPFGWFVFGLSRDETGPVELKVGSEVYRYDIMPREYAVQKISGLPSKLVTPPASALKQIKLDNQRIGAARAHDTPSEDFADGFIWPVSGPHTGVYGSQRILNGEAKQPHFGVDIAAATGTPIKATAAGVVRLARSDVYFTGGTVILDHGHGLTSTYLHLSRLDVKEGESVTPGQIIGAVGMTGRATGPHLCFRMNWFDVRLDPALLLPKQN